MSFSVHPHTCRHVITSIAYNFEVKSGSSVKTDRGNYFPLSLSSPENYARATDRLIRTPRDFVMRRPRAKLKRPPSIKPRKRLCSPCRRFVCSTPWRVEVYTCPLPPPFFCSSFLSYVLVCTLPSAAPMERG